MENNENVNSSSPAQARGCVPGCLHYAGIAVMLVAYLLYNHFMGRTPPTGGSNNPPVIQNNPAPSGRGHFDDGPPASNDNSPGVPDLNPDGTLRSGTPGRNSLPTSPQTPARPGVPSAPTTPVAPRTPSADGGTRRDLDEDQRKHGHTLIKHVGRTDEQLLERLQQEPDISSASTYSDKDTAERCVGAAIAKNDAKIKAWIERGGNQKLVLDFIGDGQQPIGRTMHRDKTSHPCFNAKIVLAMDNRGGGYFVLTSYPEAR